MLLCFFVQKLLKLNTLTQLRAVLLNSYELRSFCNLNGNVPSISTFSRFRKIFNNEIQKLFQNISIHAHNIPIRQSPELASILIFDTTGIVPKVRENNPKFIHLLLKNTSKANPQLSSDKIYSLVYSSLPKTANSFFQYPSYVRKWPFLLGFKIRCHYQCSRYPFGFSSSV